MNQVEEELSYLFRSNAASGKDQGEEISRRVLAFYQGLGEADRRSLVRTLHKWIEDPSEGLHCDALASMVRIGLKDPALTNMPAWVDRFLHRDDVPAHRKDRMVHDVIVHGVPGITPIVERWMAANLDWSRINTLLPIIAVWHRVNENVYVDMIASAILHLGRGGQDSIDALVKVARAVIIETIGDPSRVLTIVSETARRDANIGKLFARAATTVTSSSWFNEVVPQVIDRSAFDSIQRFAVDT